MQVDEKDYRRLTSNQPVGLRHAGLVITVKDVIKVCVPVTLWFKNPVLGIAALFHFCILSKLEFFEYTFYAELNELLMGWAIIDWMERWMNECRHG